MKIYIGADHRGFELKEKIKAFLSERDYDAEDMGNSAYDENDDYTEFSSAVAEKVSGDPVNSRGIVICRSGAGVDIVANKFSGVRSSLGILEEQVMAARREDDLNVLSLAADFTDVESAKRMVQMFLNTPFLGEERHKRRLQKIANIEKECQKPQA